MGGPPCIVITIYRWSTHSLHGGLGEKSGLCLGVNISEMTVMIDGLKVLSSCYTICHQAIKFAEL